MVQPSKQALSTQLKQVFFYPQSVICLLLTFSHLHLPDVLSTFIGKVCEGDARPADIDDSLAYLGFYDLSDVSRSVQIKSEPEHVSDVFNEPDEEDQEDEGVGQQTRRSVFLFSSLLFTHFPSAGHSAAHLRADWLFDWSLAAKWARLLITQLTAAYPKQ